MILTLYLSTLCIRKSFKKLVCTIIKFNLHIHNRIQITNDIYFTRYQFNHLFHNKHCLFPPSTHASHLLLTNSHTNYKIMGNLKEKKYCFVKFDWLKYQFVTVKSAIDIYKLNIQYNYLLIYTSECHFIIILKK